MVSVDRLQAVADITVQSGACQELARWGTAAKERDQEIAGAERGAHQAGAPAAAAARMRRRRLAALARAGMALHSLELTGACNMPPSSTCLLVGRQ